MVRSDYAALPRDPRPALPWPMTAGRRGITGPITRAPITGARSHEPHHTRTITRARSHELVLRGVEGGLRAVGGAGLHEDATHVVGRRVGADVQARADLLVAEPGREQAEDLD